MSYSSLIFYSLTIDNILNIIVLLILAGVSIATLTGNNGILTRANEARTQTEEAEDIEKIRLAISEAQIGENGYQELNFHSFQKALNSQFGEDNAIASISEDGTIEGTVPQYIKENNGKWLPVTSLSGTFQGHDETSNRELTKLTTAPKIPPQ